MTNCKIFQKLKKKLEYISVSIKNFEKFFKFSKFQYIVKIVNSYYSKIQFIMFLQLNDKETDSISIKLNN